LVVFEFKEGSFVDADFRVADECIYFADDLVFVSVLVHGKVVVLQVVQNVLERDADLNDD